MHTEIYEYLMLDRETQDIFFQSCNIGFQGQDKKDKACSTTQTLQSIEF